MAAKNVIKFGPVFKHLVKSPYGSQYHEGTRYLAIAEGTCNDKSFEVILYNDEGLSSTAFLYGKNTFSNSEYQSIRKKLKSTEADTTFDWRDKEDPQERIFDEMEKKHYGERVYLNVPFSEKDEASKLGAQWDKAQNKWYYMSKKFDQSVFEKWA